MTVTQIAAWEDPPEEGRSADDWPYPDRHVKFLVGGELAERIVKRLGEADGTPVFLIETTESGGYSEYTQEDEVRFKISCGAQTASFDDYSLRVEWGTSLVGRLDAWLKEVE